MEKAITVVDSALKEFERRSGLTPRVILLPRRIFEQYFREASLLAAILPDAPAPRDEREWADVRVVEHEALEEIEVY